MSSDVTGNPHLNRAAHDCLSGGGAMGALMRATDWRKTPFGPVEDWPQSLRTAVASCSNRGSRWSSRGDRISASSTTTVINRFSARSIRRRSGAEIFPEVWAVVGPEFERVRRGESFAIDDWYLPLERDGYPENCWVHAVL